MAQNTTQLRNFGKSVVNFNKQYDVANVFHSNYNVMWRCAVVNLGCLHWDWVLSVVTPEMPKL